MKTVSRIVAVVCFLISAVLGGGIVFMQRFDNWQHLPQKQQMLIILSALAIIMYLAGIIMSFIRHRAAGLTVAALSGILSLSLLYVSFAMLAERGVAGSHVGGIAVWQVYMVPGLIGAVVLFFLHRKKI